MSGRTASWWHIEANRVRCDLCPHRCSLPDGSAGPCGVRRSEGGKLIASSHGKVCVRSLDPIEKKPLFHYRPGTLVHSFGTFGCNLDCDNCQNHDLVRARSGGSSITPRDASAEASDMGAHGIAFTFNEPVTWYEFVLDASTEARSLGLYTVLNTNGYIMPEPAKELFRHTDAMNVDIKAFDEDVYRSTCGGSLRPVLDACLLARSMGVHVELTYLLVPGVNDSPD
ncbi:MAG TPA: AmmeMemoRadiSam system radical SAM enzyme, partial [Methanomassiliicoccaceae archaeon]|nr:AmmeMemoRadiSam system radical SAM enzyme [Methanomassiliicoccaceae archaeon]